MTSPESYRVRLRSGGEVEVASRADAERLYPDGTVLHGFGHDAAGNAVRVEFEAPAKGAVAKKAPAREPAAKKTAPKTAPKPAAKAAPADGNDAPEAIGGNSAPTGGEG